MIAPLNTSIFVVPLLAVFVGTLATLFNPLWAQSSNNDFLQSLKQEAEELKLDADTEIPPEALERKGILEANPSGGGGAIARITAGMSVQQFEQLLKNNYMGSFLFYKRLSDAQKDSVFQFYQQNPDSNLIREEILRLSKQ